MNLSAKEICALLKGKLEGDGSVSVSTISKIEEGEAGSLSFLANPKYEQYIYSTKASAVLVSNTFNPTSPVQTTLIRVEDPYAAFCMLLEMFGKTGTGKAGIEQPSFIDSDASIGKDVYIGAFVYIGKNAVIGDNAQIYPHAFIGDDARVGAGSTINAGVKIYDRCVVGDGCIIHSGTVIGSDGFGFAPQKDGTYKKIAQTGNVLIFDNVEIGANCTIDRATMGSTIIRSGVKLDNLIQVAHNVEIGENTVIAAQTGISGSTKLGNQCVVGGQVGFVGHISVAPGTQIGAQSGIRKPSKHQTGSGSAHRSWSLRMRSNRR
jgi:UDP-3-O-[3-hydroxymyristoyl] glucosamine N-acyltransferase